ncbi:MAG: NAD(+)/NADH kinase [Oscillospiraceae bacterium]|jgi:NAD+ kinase|nr:NAD(+)/NADH kinase [Oscillospiraceae bacterium]
MKAIICKNENKNDSRNSGIIAEVQSKLHSIGIEAVLSDRDGICQDCDLVITIGGDGTILHHGKKAARLGLPLLGINTGRLGFMTTLETNELDKLELLKTGNRKTCSRMMLDIEIGRQTYLALNDVIFLKDINSKLPELKVSTGGTVISEIRADGLILSTPTGSTAYALSAGGPIIEPRLECIELTPMCAHSLFGRPMIFSAENPLTVQFEGKPETHTVFASVDGEKAIEFRSGDVAIIRKSALRLDLIDLGGNSFHDAVNKKLMKPLK